MIDQDGAKAPEALSEEALDQASGGLLPAHTGGVNVAAGDVASAGPGGGPHIKAGDGSVRPVNIKGYEAWPC